MFWFCAQSKVTLAEDSLLILKLATAWVLTRWWCGYSTISLVEFVEADITVGRLSQF